MQTQKQKWKSIGLPEALFNTVRRLIVYTGDPSVAEYVRVAVRQRINKDEGDIEDDGASRMDI